MAIIYQRPPDPWQDVPAQRTPVRASWLDGVDDTLTDLTGPSGRVGSLEALLALLAPTTPAGQWFAATSPNNQATGAIPNNTMRVAPWLILRTTRVDRMMMDISAAGEAGSKIRLILFGDNGTGYPGDLVLDGGQVAGDAISLPIWTVNLTLAPGLYWVGGGTQLAPTTLPTMRIIGGGWNPPVRLLLGTGTPAAALTTCGYSQGAVSGAAPSTFTTTFASSNAVPRVLARAS
jgi:hypothetical protein